MTRDHRDDGNVVEGLTWALILEAVLGAAIFISLTFLI